MGLEELTKEELITLIRHTNPDLDEETTVIDVLFARSNFAWDKYREASDRGGKINDQMLELIQPFVKEPIKSGTQIVNCSAAVRKELEQLNRERQAAMKEAEMWFEKYKVASDRRRDLKDEATLRWLGMLCT